MIRHLDNIHFTPLNSFKIQKSKYYDNNFLTNNSCGFQWPLLGYECGQDLVAFRHNINNDGYTPDDFMQKYRRIYGDKPLIETISDCVKAKDCYINHGSVNVTYRIPRINDYIIRMPKSEAQNFNPEKYCQLEPIEDAYPDLNFGQPIMKNKEKIQICKKQNGLPVRACDWFQLKMCPELITHDTALSFLNDIENLSQFPLDSYLSLVSILKKIDKHKIDFLNSNNFLIDKKNKKINRVDVTDCPSDTKCTITTEDLIYPLINVFVHSYYRDVLNEEEKTRLDNATETIIKKCRITARMFDIKSDKNYPYDFWKKHIIKYMGEEKYDELQSDIKRTISRYVK